MTVAALQKHSNHSSHQLTQLSAHMVKFAVITLSLSGGIWHHIHKGENHTVPYFRTSCYYSCLKGILTYKYSLFTSNTLRSSTVYHNAVCTYRTVLVVTDIAQAWLVDLTCDTNGIPWARAGKHTHHSYLATTYDRDCWNRLLHQNLQFL